MGKLKEFFFELFSILAGVIMLSIIGTVYFYIVWLDGRDF